jgi:hypothetical protein
LTGEPNQSEAMKRDPNEHTELKITLSQAQCDALAEEAKAKGVRFFDHCRDKLLADTTERPRESTAAVEHAYAKAVADGARNTDPMVDRMDRLERMIQNIGDVVQSFAFVQDEPAHEAAGTQTDMEAMIQSRMAEAENKGLTAPRAAQHQEEPDDSDYRTIGVRRFNRPAPPNFSSLGSSGRIQREGTPTAGA